MSLTNNQLIKIISTTSQDLSENSFLKIKRILLEEIEELSTGDSKPKLYFLIGPPAVGKSEWIKKNAPSGAVVVNRDELVEKVAKQSGVGTYDEMYTRPAKKLIPAGMITKEMMLDKRYSNAVDDYILKVKHAADRFNRKSSTRDIRKKYGNLVPFDKESFELVLVKFGVKPQFIVPFEYSNIKKANDRVTSLLNLTRSTAAKDRKDIIIDMVSMSRGERDQHRKFLLNSITGNPSGDINEYYDQIAVVFAPESGYTPDMIEKIKKRAEQRSEEIKAQGGSKTIPASAYDRMFASYSPPSPDEGFMSIEFVGVPSLESLKEESFRKRGTVIVERWQRLAGLV